MKKKTGTFFYKRNTAEFFEAWDYVPKSNEILIATDTGVCKCGDGVHKWSELKEAGENE